MVATVLLASLVGGSVTDVMPVMGKWPEMIKYYNDEISHAILLLQGIKEDSSDISVDVESLDTYSLPQEQCAEPDATTFDIRSKSYLVDKSKEASAPALFKLIAIDMCEISSDQTRNIAANPKSRVAKMKKKNDSRFILQFTFLIPGPPFLAYSAYWEVNRKLIETDSTPVRQGCSSIFLRGQRRLP